MFMWSFGPRPNDPPSLRSGLVEVAPLLEGGLGGVAPLLQLFGTCRILLGAQKTT